jgi:hypothetical protein
MPVLAFRHQFFHTDTCVAHICTLRWKDRPRHCPRCHSPKSGPWGQYHDRPGLKRYRCKACRRTFNDLAQTLFDNASRSPGFWLPSYCIYRTHRSICRKPVHIAPVIVGAGGTQCLIYGPIAGWRARLKR